MIFKKESNGKLVLDRFDFQKHTSGDDFNHSASQIKLDSPLVVGSLISDNLFDILQQISLDLSPPEIQDSTSLNKGILRLTNDLSGSASNPTVSGLQNRPVTNLEPLVNQVLSWDGYGWSPTTPTNSFIANGDLNGNAIFQTVKSLTGEADIVSIGANILRFNSTNPNSFINFEETSVGNGSSLTISSQGSIGFNGGDLILASGTGTKRGDIFLRNNLTNVVSVKNLTSPDRVVLGLFSNPTAVNVPSGNGVVYISNASTNPTSNPTNGSLLYSNDGRLRVRFATGEDFVIKDLNDPLVISLPATYSSPRTLIMQATIMHNSSDTISLIGGHLSRAIVPSGTWEVVLPRPPIAAGLILESVTLRILPLGSDATTRIRARPYSRNTLGISTALSLEIQDPLTGGSYSTTHNFIIGSLNYTVNSGDEFYIDVTGESGGSPTDVNLLAAWATYSVTNATLA